MGFKMEKKDVVKLSRQIEDNLKKRYQDPTLRNQYAWWMLEKITNKKKSELIALEFINLTQEQIVTLEKWIEKQVVEHMPLQYLLGSVPFDDIEILVEPPVLIPRPETEEMCYHVLEMLKKLNNKNISILDIGTGSGCIALTLAKALPKSTIYATDISQKAIDLAQKNAKNNNIDNVKFLKSDLYENIKKNITFDLIISNPPYISADEWKSLDNSVTKWEDPKALVARDEGLAIIEKIISLAPQFIKSNDEFKNKKIPQLIIEIGYKQGVDVAKLFEKAGFANIKIEQDIENKDRFVTGRLP